MTREELQQEFETLRNQAIYLIQTFNTYNDLFFPVLKSSES